MGLHDILSGIHVVYCGVFRDINFDSPFAQPPLKIVEL